MDIEPIEYSEETLRKRKIKMLVFAAPLTIQVLLTLVHLASAHNLDVFPEPVYRALSVATFVYTFALLLLGVIAATSMTMESICAKIKKADDRERQWIRDYFKASKKFNPAYNGSFSGVLRKLIAGACSAVYVFALVLDGFVGNAITVLFSVCLIWFGIWMVRVCNRLVKEAKLREEARKAKARKASAEVSAISGAYGEI